MSHQRIKLQVVHRNTELRIPSEPMLTSRLQKLCLDLDEIAKLIEKEVDTEVSKSYKLCPSQSHH
ncbi:MAG TPA: hypothetical protein VI603_08125 [Saprospiraceae bacterium]|nr:hypothetical protein [Saprospiraceae bacterium]